MKVLAKIQYSSSSLRVKLLLSTLILTSLLLGCLRQRGPEDELVFESVLPPVGLIIEYEVSPDGQFVATSTPTEAIEAGSDAYKRIMRDSVFDEQQITVFDVETEAVVNQSQPTRDVIVNLRWSADGRELLYISWAGKSQHELVRWNVLSNELTRAPFPHTGFDVSPSGQTVAAWGEESLVEDSDELRIYDFSTLQEVRTLTIRRISDIEHADWSMDGSWLLIDSGPQLLRLEWTSEKTEKLADRKAVSTFPPLLDPTGRFLLGWDIGVTLFDLSQRCAILHLDPPGRGKNYENAEWAEEPGHIYLVFAEHDAAQQTILKVDLSEIIEADSPSCISRD